MPGKLFLYASKYLFPSFMISLIDVVIIIDCRQIVVGTRFFTYTVIYCYALGPLCRLLRNEK